MTKILAANLWHGSGVTMTLWDKSQLPLATAWYWDKFLVSMTSRDLNWLVLSCLFWLDSVADPGEGPPYFSTKMKPEEPKIMFLETATTPLSQGLDDQPPPPPSLLPRRLSDGLDPPLWLKVVRKWNTVQLNTRRITERILSRFSDL